MSKNKHRNKVGDNRARETLRKGQKIYFSGSSKVVPACPSSKGNILLILKYALTSYFVGNTLPLYYK